MKALIVDGEELFRLSLIEVVSVAGDFEDIITAGSENEFFARTALHEDLDLIMVHPASLDGEGRACMKLARRLYPSAALVTILGSEEHVALDMASMISVSRKATISQMVSAIRRAMKLPIDSIKARASQTARPDVRSALVGTAVPAPTPVSREQIAMLGRLSFRQRQILAMAADGLPNKEIAARLSIAEGTVKAHMHAIFKVLGVSNRTQAVIKYGAAGSPPAPADDAAPRRLNPSWNNGVSLHA